MGAPLNSSSESGFWSTGRLFMTKGDFNSTHIRQVFEIVFLSSFLYPSCVFLSSSSLLMLCSSAATRVGDARVNLNSHNVSHRPAFIRLCMVYALPVPRRILSEFMYSLAKFVFPLCKKLGSQAEELFLSVLFFVHSFSLLFHVLLCCSSSSQEMKKLKNHTEKKTLKSLYVWNYCRDYRTWISDTESRKSIIKQSWTSESFFFHHDFASCLFYTLKGEHWTG